jgi:hypothetical protein
MTAGSQISQPFSRLIVRLFVRAGGAAAAAYQPLQGGSKKMKDALHMASESERVESSKSNLPLYSHVNRA